MKLFQPTDRQIHRLLIVGFTAVGYALYMRYLGIEHTATSRLCEEGLKTWLCSSRSVMIQLLTHSVFGGIALVAAALNFIRPSILLALLSVGAAGMGLVLYNVTASALAVGLLVLSFARRAPE